MNKDEALKLAQKALSNRNAPVKIIYEALHAIKEALAQPTSGDYALGYSIGFGEGHSAGKALAQPKEPEQEPVAWRVWNPDGEKQYAYSENGDGEPLYTTSSQRKPLTDEEVEKIIKSNMSLQMNLAGIRADIEAAHNIKE